MKSWLLILGAAITLLNYAAPIAAKKRVVCYYGSWSTYRPGDGKFEVEYIDPNLCTHAIYSFVGLEWTGVVRILDTFNEINKGGFRRLNELRKRNPELKTLVALGGWGEGSTRFSPAVNDPTRRANLVNSIVEFVKQYGFDGFDLDWEYPAQRGGAASDKDDFSKLLEELRREFDKHGFLLSAAVASVEASASLSYHIPDLGRYLDFINIMTYDMHGSWDPVTGHSAPLYPGAVDDGFTVHQAIQYWIRAGAPREKINVGIGTYGSSFTLSGNAQCVFGAPAIGAGLAGPYTREAGTLGYNEICENLSTWNVRWDDQQKVAYACNGNQFVGFDNIESTILKTEYAVQEGLGGVMIWSVETDDFLGKCHGFKYPLLTAINHVLFGGIVTEGKTTTTASTTPTTTPTTAETSRTDPPKTSDTPTTGNPSPSTTTGGDASDPSSLCTQEGFIKDPSNRRVFYECQKVSDKFVAYRFECAVGLAFDTSINVCNWDYNVPN